MKHHGPSQVRALAHGGVRGLTPGPILCPAWGSRDRQRDSASARLPHGPSLMAVPTAPPHLFFNSSPRTDHWHGESECESVAKLRGWCSGPRKNCIILPSLWAAFQVAVPLLLPHHWEKSKVLVPAQSLCTNYVDEYLSAHCEPYLCVQDPKGLVESRFMHLLFLCTQK